MAGKCLTDLCGEARQRKWLSDPSYEFIVQGQTKTKKTDEKKEKEKKATEKKQKKQK